MFSITEQRCLPGAIERDEEVFSEFILRKHIFKMREIMTKLMGQASGFALSSVGHLLVFFQVSNACSFTM